MSKQTRLEASDEETSLLHSETGADTITGSETIEEEEPVKEQNPLLASQMRRLYVSHFLSTWNSRMFEFGAVLYIGTLFPSSLLQLSLYALVRGLAGMVMSSQIGRFIDTTDRLQCVRLSIVGQRVPVAISCLLFWLLRNYPTSQLAKLSALISLGAFACVEKVAATMNLVAVEKDWVVVLAGADRQMLATMNAKLRRIDLVCKLVAPLCIATLNDWSPDVAILANLGINVISVAVEYIAIAVVYHRAPLLQQNKRETDSLPANSATRASTWRSIPGSCRSGVQDLIKDYVFYIRHPAFLASFSGACLYLTVLSFGGQMITYLIANGVRPFTAGLSRTCAVVFEVLATWVAPPFVRAIGPVRSGLWGIVFQNACLWAALVLFWPGVLNTQFAGAMGLVTGTIISRLGLRVYDLSTSIIVQESVEPENRGKFSSMEAGWQNLFEIVSYASTIVYSRPSDFRWPVLLSVAAVSGAGLLFAKFTHQERGHLVHYPGLLKAPSDSQN